MKSVVLCQIVIICLFLGNCTIKDTNNGVQEDYYPNGVIRSQIMLKNGQKNGIVKYFDNKGRLLSETEYVDDLKNGKLTNYNTETGKPTMEAFFIDDVQHGEVTQYYREGMLFRKSTYINGRVDGLVTTFWPGGSIKAENEFKNGLPALGLKEYDKQGRILTQPKLIIQKSVSRRNAIDISIFGDYDSADIYIDELVEGKYFNPKSRKLRLDNGKAFFDYSVLLYSQGTRQVSIIAKVKTNYGNTLILSKAYPF